MKPPALHPSGSPPSVMVQGQTQNCRELHERHRRCGQWEPSCTSREVNDVERPDYIAEDRLSSDEADDIIEKRLEVGRAQLRQSAINAVQTQSSSVSSRFIARAYQDRIVSFLWENFTIRGPEYSSREFIDIVKEHYSEWSTDSAATLATNTVASELFSIWSAGRISDNTIRRLLGRAIRRINESLSGDVAILQDDTLLAILLLQFHNDVSSYRNLSKGSCDHLDGACAVVSYRGTQNSDSIRSQRLLQVVRHHLVCSAIRATARMKLRSDVWSGSLEVYRPKLVQLDQHGLEVAELRASYVEMRQLMTGPEAIHSHENVMTVAALLTQAVTVDTHLRAWENNLTLDWLPARIPVPSLRPSTFSSPEEASRRAVGFDAYRSVQTADSMNQYRIYRLICLQVMWSCHIMQRRDEISRRHGFQEQFWCGRLSDSDAVSYQIQKLVDQICDSVAFHLSDRKDIQSLGELSRNQAATGTSTTSSQLSSPQSTGDEPREPITVGSWYILGPLSFLTQSFSPRAEADIGLSPLREGQFEWIKSRLLRVMETHGVAGSSSTLDDDHIGSLPNCLRYTPKL